MRPIAVILLILLSTSIASAQHSSIHGLVADSAGTPIHGAAVLLLEESGLRIGTTTDSTGSFHFPDLLPGSFVITASHVGFESDVDTLTIGFDERHLIHLTLREEAESLEEITVSESAGQGDASPRAARYHIQASQLQRLSVPGLAPDLMGYLLTIPGAVRVGDSGGHLFIRGGRPTQNLVLIDGMPLYQPFHIVGFYSAFPADIISYADVYAGGFGARYGGRLSSVIDVTTRNGNKRQVAGAVSLAPFLSTARIEIPIHRDVASLTLSARESVIERLGPALTDRDFPFRFGDYFGKFHAFLTRTSSFSATAIRTYDRGTFDLLSNRSRTISWQNSAVGGRYVYLPEDYPVMAQLAVHVSRYESDYTSAGGDRRSDASGINGDISFTYLLGAQQLDFGIFGRSNTFDFAFGTRRPGIGREHVTEGGGYIDLSLKPATSLEVRTGIRAHGFSSGIGTSIEPRIQVQVRPAGFLEGQSFGLAGGIYHQQIIGLTALEDVTDVFIAWQPSAAQRPVPRATHLIASWTSELGSRTLLRAEGYVKSMSNLATPRYDNRTNTLLRIDQLDGAARGIDVQLEHSSARLYLTVGYGLAEVVYEGVVPWTNATLFQLEREQRFHPPHDRRHQVNVAAEYDAGGFRLKALWQFASGHPFTQIYGFFPLLGEVTANDAYRTAAAQRGIALGEPFQGRMPTYHRLDVSVERHFGWNVANLAVQAGVVNAYNRANLFDFDLFTGERTNQLPLIPYVGVRVSVD